MSFERTGAMPMGEAAPQPTVGTVGTAGAGQDVPPALRLQILATEHWSLLATRSMAWNEIFARAGMLLSALSGAIVALALVGQGSNFGSSFVLFGIIILPVVLFIGETTYIRMSTSNLIDATTVIGMNRIRAGYLAIAPELEPYFVTGTHDDMRGISMTMATRPGPPPISHLLAATPTVVSVINAAIAGAIAGLLLIEAGAATAPIVLASIVVFVVVVAIHAVNGRRIVEREMAKMIPRFPGPAA